MDKSTSQRICVRRHHRECRLRVQLVNRSRTEILAGTSTRVGFLVFLASGQPTRLTLVHPAAVDKLALVDSAGLGKEAATILKVATLPVLGELLTRPSPSGTARFAKMLVHDPAVMTSDSIDLWFQMASLPGARQSFLRTLRANVNPFGQSKSVYGPNINGLGSITKPVLVVWGRQDRIIPAAHADTAAKNLPNASVRIFDDCGHFAMLEHTPDFNDLLLGFLAD